MRRLVMDLEPGTRFLLFRRQQPYEVASLWWEPYWSVRVRPCGSHRGGSREAWRLVERWVLTELAEGRWPWPGRKPVDTAGKIL